MTLVRILRDYDFPDILRQTPGGRGEWGGIRFTEEPVAACDAAVVLNAPGAAVRLRCPPGRVWAVMQEPPNEHFGRFHHGEPVHDRVYTTRADLVGPRYRHVQPALPWHVGRSYDELSACPPPAKSRGLSWITSNATAFAGHRRRMRFLETVRGRLDFDLFGRGFTPVADKWDALAPYRFSLAVENHAADHYFTEKLTDCLLAWTVPVYAGCPNVGDYFPPEAVIVFDPDDPRAPEAIAQAMHAEPWARRLEALAEARRLVLDRLQLFPFLAGELAACPPGGAPRRVRLAPPRTGPGPLRRAARAVGARLRALAGGRP